MGKTVTYGRWSLVKLHGELVDTKVAVRRYVTAAFDRILIVLVSGLSCCPQRVECVDNGKIVSLQKLTLLLS